MRFLVVEDDLTSRKLLQAILSKYGECDVVVNGREALQAFTVAAAERRPYRLICLDLMMPEMDGQTALMLIREDEKRRGIPQEQAVKVIMTTALDSPKDLFAAYSQGGCSSYNVKPIDKKKLIDQIKELGLISA